MDKTDCDRPGFNGGKIRQILAVAAKLRCALIVGAGAPLVTQSPIAGCASAIGQRIVRSKLNGLVEIINRALEVAQTLPADRAQVVRHGRLLVENETYFHAARVDYHGGERYPHLERIEGQPDLLGEIAKSKAPPVAPAQD